MQTFSVNVDKLAVPGDMGDRQAVQRCGSRVIGLQNADRPQLDTDDGQAASTLAQEVDERLNLWELRHSLILAQVASKQKAPG